MRALATLLVLASCALCAPATLRAQVDPEYGEQDYASEESETSEDNTAAVEAGDERTLLARVAAGVGLGMRTLAWPQNGSTADVDLGVFPALDLRAGFWVGFSRSFLLGTSFAYQSSFAHEIREPRVGGLRETQAVRSHRFEAALVPELHFDDELHLLVYAGYAVRNLHPEMHFLQTPRVTLSGPFVRPMLRVALSADSVALRFGPELQWIAALSTEFEERGVKAGGIAVGGELVLEVRLSTMFAVELAYRESHALLAAAIGTDGASDVERFVTARLAGEL